MYLGRMYILLLSGVVIHKYQLGHSGWWCCSNLLQLNKFFAIYFVSYWERNRKVSNYVFRFVYFQISLVLSIFFHVLGNSVIGCLHILNDYIFLMIWPFSIMKYSSLPQVIFLVVKSTLSDVNVAIPTFLCSVFCMVYLFLSFYLQLLCVFVHVNRTELFYLAWCSLPFNWCVWQIVFFKGRRNNISHPTCSSGTFPFSHQEVGFNPLPIIWTDLWLTSNQDDEVKVVLLDFRG